ncbi:MULTISPECIES: hypothetical protein [Streptomyces]|uniref:Uncharacterized protein n=1 Tax=Streptomyces eurythermus TaxID=42237 RepID=A0ABW6YV72_9ACTN|nr:MULTISPECIES: hypothetical protein [Streptomyces]QIS70410.1 hypothetical protein HB370_10680 [Streptomyces sp. DSM 40868]
MTHIPGKRLPRPGAVLAVTADRPQPSDADAASYTVADHLRGTDGRAPFARR